MNSLPRFLLAESMMSRQASVSGSCAQGAFCDLHVLIALRATATRIRLQAPRPHHAPPGQHAGLRRGRGIEFEESRVYEAGDDVRTIDWRITARSGRVHTRVFREERERPVFLLVDQRREMFFGSRRTLKSVQAVHCAALLAWATLASGDRVGGLVIGEQQQHEVRPRRSHRAVLELLRRCTELNHRLGIPSAVSTPAKLAPAFTALRRIVRPGSLIITISDFATWDEAAARELHLLARHAEVSAIHVFDPLERELPAAGVVLADDGRCRVTLDCGDTHTRSQHRTLFDARTAEVAQAFGRAGGALVALPTDGDAAGVLDEAFRAAAR